jgi:DNA-damage-inducible protein D
MTTDDDNSTTANSNTSQTPNFDSIRQISPYGVEYWSARDLSKLLGYTSWRNFEVAINRAITSCEQVGKIPDDHFVGDNKPIKGDKGAVQNVKDFVLIRLACYHVIKNGDPPPKSASDLNSSLVAF